MRRAPLTLLVLMLVIPLARAQEQQAVDRTDPEAVVKAYVEACEKGDVNGAVSLLSAGELLRSTFQEMVGELERGEAEGFNFGTVFMEFDFLPLGNPVFSDIQGSSVEGDQATVAVALARPDRRQFVLVRAEDGTWSIDLEKSLLKTTGAKTSLILRDFTQRRGGESGPSVSHLRQQGLRRLANVLMKYVRETGNVLPEADIWIDVLEEYCLDRSVLHRPDVGKDEYGYALNSNLAGEALWGDWQARRSTVILFETDDLSRNVAADVYEALAEAADADKPLLVATAVGEVFVIQPGTSLDEMMSGWEHSSTCQRRVQLLCRALLAYARDNEGLLPPAESWCDAVGPYVEPEQSGPEVFECPARPDLEYAYAINEALAGKDVRTLAGHSQYVLLLPAKDGVCNEALEVPEKVEAAWHTRSWDRGRKCITIGRLDGSTTTLAEGARYPQPPGD